MRVHYLRHTDYGLVSGDTIYGWDVFSACRQMIFLGAALFDDVVIITRGSTMVYPRPIPLHWFATRMTSEGQGPVRIIPWVRHPNDRTYDVV